MSGRIAVLVLAALLLAGCGRDAVDVRFDFSRSHGAGRVIWPHDLDAFSTPAKSVTIRFAGGLVYHADGGIADVSCERISDPHEIGSCQVTYDPMPIPDACRLALGLSREWRFGTSNTRDWCRHAKAQLAAGAHEYVSTIGMGGGLPHPRRLAPDGLYADVDLQTTTGQDERYDEGVVHLEFAWPAR